MLVLNTVGWLYCLNMNGVLAVFILFNLEREQCNPAAQMLKILSTVLLYYIVYTGFNTIYNIHTLPLVCTVF